jgi:Ca2+-binding EF-hand superfamily protein
MGGSLTSTDRGSDAIGRTGNFGLDERELDVLFKFIDGDGSGRIDVEELR